MIETLHKQLKEKKGYIGHSNTLLPVIEKGKETEQRGIRVYVKKKLPVDYINKRDLLPRYYNETRLDVVEIGEVNALKEKVDKTARTRPVTIGVSIGHWLISAGSLGIFPVYKEDKILVGSNAHVLTPNSSLSPEQIKEKRILQPGSYHSGQNPDNVVGEYYWHKQIIPMDEGCSIGNFIVKGLNFLAKLFGSSTRLSLARDNVNHIDFAVYEPSVEHIAKIADSSFKEDLPFIGLLFAGSKQVGVICKAEYMVKEGYSFAVPIKKVKEKDEVIGCSLWCNYKTIVTDPSATIQVNYGQFNALFDDVILVKNENVIRGGYSGSGWRLVSNGGSK